MRPSVVIVGAGLGGCVLADALAGAWDVTVVEMGGRDGGLQGRVIDLGKPAVTFPHVASGLGGTTSAWHNGLIEIDEDVFRDRWPFPKSELEDCYDQAFRMLSGVPRGGIRQAVGHLRESLVAAGVPAGLLREGLYYPSQRINIWKSLKLEGRVKLVAGEVVGFSIDGDLRISGVKVRQGNQELDITADEFVLAAGGLGTPILLQRLAAVTDVPALKQAGRHYEDHPSGFVAEFVSDMPLYKLWNYAVPVHKGHLRLPMVVVQDGLHVSFQLRPAVQFGPRNKVVSILSDLRNRPFDLRNYVRLLAHWDDILDILSLRFGIQVPTRHYTLLMVAEQPPTARCSISADPQPGKINRNWELGAAYLESIGKAIDQALGELAPFIRDVRVFAGWAANLFSSSHHSGTARMHVSPESGVCDGAGRVHGLANLHICDGSAIPASGSANTGLTIAALALRMAATFPAGKL